MLETCLFRIGSFARFLLRSGNTLGFGVHSPRLFYIANTLIPEQARYYCFEDIEKQRAKAQSKAPKTLLPRRYAQLLFRLSAWMHAETIVEIGTSAGLTTAYLAKADSRAQVYSFGGEEPLLSVACGVWKELDIRNITAIAGNVADALRKWIDGEDSKRVINLAFMGLDDTGDEALRYFDLLAAHANEDSIFVLDDIRCTRQAYHVWKVISNRECVTATFDLGRMGMVFFDSHLPKQRFGIRM